jgi:hypothetical protein
VSLYPNWLVIEGRRYRPEPAGTLPRDMRFVRVLHELELAPHLERTTPPSRPEVRQMYPENLFVPFGKAWQLFAWKLNPLLKANNMTAVYDDHLWIANNNGFSDDLRANYFTNENLDKPLPKVETLTCGGNLLRVLGEVAVKIGTKFVDSYIIDVLDYRQAPPTLEWIEARPWLITIAVNMGSDGTPRRFTQGTQPNGFVPGVRHPFLSDPSKRITIPKWRCVEWREANAPDPYFVYLKQ